jgi:hypothetical protein
MLKSQEFIYCKVKPLQEPVSIIFLFFLRDNKLRSFFLCYQTDLYGRGMWAKQESKITLVCGVTKSEIN